MRYPNSKRISAYLKWLDKGGPLIALILLCIYFSFKNSAFWTLENLTNITRQASCNGFLSLGMLPAILIGGIDLSVGSIMALSSILMGVFVAKGGGTPVAGIFICIFSGTLLGFINGLLLTKLRLPHPFIATLGTQNIYRGLCLIITTATPISGFPGQVNWAGAAFIGEFVPASFMLMVLAYILFAVFLNKCTLGRHIYAVGGNAVTARLSGINVDFVRNVVFAISGMMCGVAGLILTGRVDAVYPLAGISWETDAIAAVIIGGTSFFGGKGNTLGVFSGVFLIAVLRNGLNLLDITADWQTVALGAVIILAVFIDVLRRGEFAFYKN